jgi:hypothetical protein
MISPISFQGTYKIDASKASPLCQLCGVAEVVKYADSVDGTGFDRKNFYKTLDKPFTVKLTINMTKDLKNCSKQKSNLSE